MLSGTLRNREDGWFLTYRYNHLDRGYERHELPVNPNDIKKLNPSDDDGKVVKFEVITIAHGTTEFDVMDIDVAKIFF